VTAMDCTLKLRHAGRQLIGDTVTGFCHPQSFSQRLWIC
jgi:hypothetical protein